VSQNFLFPQRDQPLLLPVDMREWPLEDDLVHVVLDAANCTRIMRPSPGFGPGTRGRWAGCSARCCGCWPPPGTD